MFGEKCPKCDGRVKKKHDFCAHCGINLNAEDNLDSDDFGFLGKNDNFDMKLPFGFNALMKPLMKELSKQMLELDKELKKEQSNTSKEQPKGKSIGHFSIHIGMPGSKPIKLDLGPGQPAGKQVLQTKSNFNLPKISNEDFDKAKKYSRETPITNVRRLSDRIIYEFEIPGVSSIDKVNVSVLEEGIEIKAIGDKKVYEKLIDVELPLAKIQMKKDFLVLELGLK
jgi:hypothetical protein